MKQEEKTKRSYEKILNAAVEEFGTKSYESTSLNTVCAKNGISKGLIYHNFKSKDELYLKCVELCFKKLAEELTSYTDSEEYRQSKAWENVERILTMRHRFFRDNPSYGNIFFNAVLKPPEHLVNEIAALMRELDSFNIKLYRELISQIKLRDGITEDMAVDYFVTFQEMFNGYFRSRAYRDNDFHSFVEEHETKLSSVLNMMLYGIAIVAIDEH